MDRFGPSEDCPVCGQPQQFGSMRDCPRCDHIMCYHCLEWHDCPGDPYDDYDYDNYDNDEYDDYNED